MFVASVSFLFVVSRVTGCDCAEFLPIKPSLTAEKFVKIQAKACRRRIFLDGVHREQR